MMGRKFYYLSGKTPVATHDINEWAEKWGASETSRVALDSFGDVDVSTIFVGGGVTSSDGPPLLFETMIFGGVFDEHKWRYSTWDEAVEGHKAACKMVQGGE